MSQRRQPDEHIARVRRLVAATLEGCRLVSEAAAYRPPCCPRPAGILDRVWVEHLRGERFPDPPPADPGDVVVRGAFVRAREEAGALDLTMGC